MNLHDRGTGAATLTDTVDLTNCDREPIHIPGAIQPVGLLLALRAARIIQGAAKTAARLG